MTASSDTELYYDPFDTEIDKDPHPVWRRLRDEAPLYYNEKHDFFALSRFDDVNKALLNWDTYRSGRGSTLEIIKANVTLPPGIILMEDPPIHDLHRGLLSRVFTPRKMTALEPKVRNFCARSLDPLVGAGGFDFIADLGAQMPMRTIGMLLGIPEQDQEAIRDMLDEGMRIEEGEEYTPPGDDYMTAQGEVFADYVDWRADHPSDDLMTELLVAEFEDEAGELRRLTREEVLTYIMLLASVGLGNCWRSTRTSGGIWPKTVHYSPERLRRYSATRHRLRCRRAMWSRTSSTMVGSCEKEVSCCCSMARPTVTNVSFPTPIDSISIVKQATM